MRAVSQNINIGKTISNLLLSLFILFTGCFPIFNNKVSNQKTYVDRSYYPNGAIEYEAEYFNHKLDGISRHWSETGILLSESEYNNGQPHGLWLKYHLDGNIMNEIHYFHGQKHGYENWYYKNGIMKSQTEYNYGKIIGPIIRWDPSGLLIY